MRHVVKAESPIRVAELQLAENLPALVKLALELALEGDKALIVYCIDRVLGKPTQPISLVDAVRALAIQEGLTDEETAEAVAEAERIMRPASHARS